MKRKTCLILAVGFWLIQVIPAGAVLQSKSNADNAAEAGANPSVSKMVPKDSSGSAEGESRDTGGGNQATMRIRLGLKPVQSVSENKAPQPPEAEDPYKLGTSKTAPPAAVVPEPVSPVVKTVSGPKQNFRVIPMQMRSTKPASAVVSVESSRSES